MRPYNRALKNSDKIPTTMNPWPLQFVGKYVNETDDRATYAMVFHGLCVNDK